MDMKLAGYIYTVHGFIPVGFGHSSVKYVEEHNAWIWKLP